MKVNEIILGYDTTKMAIFLHFYIFTTYLFMTGFSF